MRVSKLRWVLEACCDEDDFIFINFEEHQELELKGVLIMENETINTMLFIREGSTYYRDKKDKPVGDVNLFIDADDKTLNLEKENK